MAVAVPAFAEARQELPVPRELLNAVVAPIGNVDVVEGIDSNAPGLVELAVAPSELAPPEQELAVAGELLDSVVVLVDQVGVVLGVEVYARRAVQLPVAVAEFAPFAQEHTLGIEDRDAVLDTVRGIAKELGKTMVQVAVNWVLSHPEVTVTISGSDNVEQLDDNLGAIGWELSQEEMARLNDVSSGGHLELMGV